MSAIAFPVVGVVGYATDPSGDGLSLDSKTIINLLKETYDHFGRPVSRQQLDYTLISLEKVFADCSEANWDGYNAHPISFGAYEEAKRFLELLPSYLPMPEIVPEPTGEIGLEWYREKQFVFVISVGGNNIITYAGIFGESSKTHGTEEFFGELIPPAILQNIRRLFS